MLSFFSGEMTSASREKRDCFTCNNFCIVCCKAASINNLRYNECNVEKRGVEIQKTTQGKHIF